MKDKMIVRTISHYEDGIFVGFDTFKDLQERAGRFDGTEYYTLSSKIKEPYTNQKVKDLEIACDMPTISEDEIRKPTLEEYVAFGIALKTNGYKINKKTGEIKKKVTSLPF